MPGPSSSTSRRAPVGSRRPRAPSTVPVGRRVAHRVLDEVRDDLVQALGVGVEREVARHASRSSKRTSVACSCDSRTACSSIGRDVEQVAIERQRARLEAGEVEQLLHEPAEALDLGEHRAQRLGIGVADAVDEVLEHGLQRGDRRAQLVAHVGDEVAAQAVGLGQLGRHLVERAGERADLVVRDGGDAVR